MKIAMRPKVYLVGKMTIYPPGFHAFLEDNKLQWPTLFEGKDCETLTEMAGRICYASFGSRAVSKSNRDYIQNLLGFNKDGTTKPGPAHGAVLEHATFSFVVVGAGRGWSHEIVRHRAGWAYSQISTRYVDFEQRETVKDGDWEPTFCIPPMAQLNDATRLYFEESCRESQERYAKAVEMIEADLINNQEFMETLKEVPERERNRMIRKAARGGARDILVHATEAMMFMTANARALWNCIGLRASEHAEGVIRDVFVQIAEIMKDQMPSVFGNIKFKKCWDNSISVELPREHI